MPWPTEGDNDYDEPDHDFHSTAATSDAFARYLDLNYTRQSHSSDVTKVGSPPIDFQSPFFVDYGGATKRTSFSSSLHQQKRVSGGGGHGAIVAGGLGMQTPPISRHTNLNHGSDYYGGKNDVGPMNEARNLEELPTFATEDDWNRNGVATAIASTVGAVVPSSPQSPPGLRSAAPLPSSFKVMSSGNMTHETAAEVVTPMVMDTNLEVGPFGEVRDPNRLPEFQGDVDLNRAGSSAHPEPSPFTSISNNNASSLSYSNASGGGGGSRQQHQATLPENPNNKKIKRSSPPAGPVTLSSVPPSSAKTKTTANNSNNSTTNNNGINPRTTTHTANAASAATRLSPLHPLSQPFPLSEDAPPLVVGSFGETSQQRQQHIMAGLLVSPLSPSRPLRLGQGATSGSSVDLNRPIQKHQGQHQTTMAPDPFQLSHPAYDPYTKVEEGDGDKDGKSNPFLLLSRRTSTGVARRRPLSPADADSTASSRSLPPQLEQPPLTNSTNPFRPQPLQWPMTSPPLAETGQWAR